MNADSKADLNELRVDGGATANSSLLQFQADVLQIPVVRSKTAETTALGAAYLAGLAVGFWLSKGDVAHHWQADSRFEPQMPASQADLMIGRWHEAVHRALHWEA
jgi:glycerol kinase